MAIMGITFAPEAVISVSPNFAKDELSLLYPTITEALAKADELAGYREEVITATSETLELDLLYRPVLDKSFKLYRAEDQVLLAYEEGGQIIEFGGSDISGTLRCDTGHLELSGLTSIPYILSYYTNGKRVLVEVYPKPDFWQEDLVLRSRVMIDFKAGAVLKGSPDAGTPAIEVRGSVSVEASIISHYFYPGNFFPNPKDIVLLVKNEGSWNTSPYAYIVDSGIYWSANLAVVKVENNASFYAVRCLILHYSKTTMIFEGYAIDRVLDNCLIGTENIYNPPAQAAIEVKGPVVFSGPMPALYLRQVTFLSPSSYIKVEDPRLQVVGYGLNILNDTLNYKSDNARQIPQAAVAGLVNQGMDAKPETLEQEIWSETFDNANPGGSWATLNLETLLGKRYLLYDNLSGGSFTVDATLTGPNATAVIEANEEFSEVSGTGVLTLKWVRGTFADNDSITDGTATASANGTPGETLLRYQGATGTFIVGDQITGAQPSNTTGTLRGLQDDGDNSGKMVIQSATGIYPNEDTLSNGTYTAAANGASQMLYSDLPALVTGLIIQVVIEYAYAGGGSPTPIGPGNLPYLSLLDHDQTGESREVELYPQVLSVPITFQVPLGMTENSIDYKVADRNSDYEFEISFRLLGWFFGWKEWGH